MADDFERWLLEGTDPAPAAAAGVYKPSDPEAEDFDSPEWTYYYGPAAMYTDATSSKPKRNGRSVGNAFVPYGLAKAVFRTLVQTERYKTEYVQRYFGNESTAQTAFEEIFEEDFLKRAAPKPQLYLLRAFRLWLKYPYAFYTMVRVMLTYINAKDREKRGSLRGKRQMPLVGADDVIVTEFHSEALFSVLADNENRVYKVALRKKISENPADELYRRTSAYPPTCAILRAVLNILGKRYGEDFDDRVKHWDNALPFLPWLQRIEDQRNVTAFATLCCAIGSGVFTAQDASIVYDMYFKLNYGHVTLQMMEGGLELPAPQAYRRLFMLGFSRQEDGSKPYDGDWKADVRSQVRMAGIAFGKVSERLAIDNMLKDPTDPRWAIITAPVQLVIVAFMRWCPDNAVLLDKSFFKKHVERFKTLTNAKTRFAKGVKPEMVRGAIVTMLINEMHKQDLQPNENLDISDVSFTLDNDPVLNAAMLLVGEDDDVGPVEAPVPAAAAPAPPAPAAAPAPPAAAAAPAPAPAPPAPAAGAGAGSRKRTERQFDELNVSDTLAEAAAQVLPSYLDLADFGDFPEDPDTWEGDFLDPDDGALRITNETMAAIRRAGG